MNEGDARSERMPRISRFRVECRREPSLSFRRIIDRVLCCRDISMHYQNSPLPSQSPYVKMFTSMTRMERVFFWLAILNLCAFVAGVMILGGDALNGTTQDGHYFVMEHKLYTEVSHSAFIYSTIHTLSLFLTFPLGIIAGLRARFRAADLPDYN